MSERKLFSLVEMIVVIAVIAILVGIMVPALGSVREKGRQTQCKSNLRQLQIACYDTYNKKSEYPSWLSNLYSKPIGDYKVMLCPSDSKKEEAVRPTAGDTDKDKIKSAWDNRSTPTAADYDSPNDDVPRVSYVYEFCGGVLPSGWNSDPDKTGVSVAAGASWQEMKLKVLKAAEKQKLGYSTRMPLIRCFWHTKKDLEPVLNVSTTGNVYWSKSDWQQGVDL